MASDGHGWSSYVIASALNSMHEKICASRPDRGNMRAVTSSAVARPQYAASSDRPDITAELNAFMNKGGTSSHAKGASRAVPVAGWQGMRPDKPSTRQGCPQVAKNSLATCAGLPSRP